MVRVRVRVRVKVRVRVRAGVRVKARLRVRVRPSVDLVDGHDEGLVEEEGLDALEERDLVRGWGWG